MNPVNRTKRERVYMNHIKRLEAHNRELASALVEERIYRKKAYDWYQKRLLSRWMAIFDMMTWSMRSK